MKKLLNNLRWLLGLPFIGVAWLFYQIHVIVDPYSNWELAQFEVVDYFDWDDFDFDDDEDCC